MFLPIVAKTFVELGYRRSTTAEIAGRCGVQENVLYRIWPNKKAMFLAAIGFNREVTTTTWRGVVEAAEESQGKKRGGRSAAEMILEHEAGHHGDWGLHRLAFAGLNEIDDEEILLALQGMYETFVGFIVDVVAKHREAAGLQKKTKGDLEVLAWGFVGLATAADIGRDLRLMDGKKRAKLMRELGGVLLK
ncbi:Nucleoid occlusion factor SlmA [Poriferisphaera corsica]|uniref:Nucleoid occlusion factor SlmA n=1 Tax=Poriferisphaera corsica TaxID=2528020 RepID=A0A517YT21_9BACT|nr:TetR/AcrR family transcriptional regulator [Poriferisphaera corsica]QDU33387.1 Nucleoid occlusion factor SlmA [Poriferisphaera corsica]